MWERVDSKDVMRRFTEFANKHDEQCPIKRHIRKTANGEIPVYRKEGTISESLTTTFHSLLGDYLNHYNHVRQIMHPSLQDPASPPKADTNAVKVGKHCRAEARTVRNHVSRLIELGVIGKEFRGSNSDIRMWITPKFLYGNEPGSQKQKAAQNAPLAVPVKNFPHTYTQGKINKPETRGADMFVLQGENFQGERGKTDRDPGEERGYEDVQRKQGEKEIPGAARRENLEKMPPGLRKAAKTDTSWLDSRIAEFDARKPQGPSGIKPQFVEMLLQFWLTASQTLYGTERTNRTFSKHESEMAILAIMKGVYGDFKAKRSDQQWTVFQDELILRLSKAARYFDKNLDKYPSAPYSIHKQGKGYFDAENENGFIKTLAWLRADQGKAKTASKAAQKAKIQKSNAEFAKAEQERVERELMEGKLTTARYDFIKLQNGKEPRADIAHIKFANMPELALFNHWNSYFARFGRKWQEEFIQQYQAGQARKFKQPLQYNRRGRQSAKVDKAEIVYWADWMDEGGYRTVSN